MCTKFGADRLGFAGIIPGSLILRTPKIITIISVAAGFGRHGMPPPAYNDTGTAFCFLNEEAEMRCTDDVSLLS